MPRVGYVFVVALQLEYAKTGLRIYDVLLDDKTAEIKVGTADAIFTGLSTTSKALSRSTCVRACVYEHMSIRMRLCTC